VSGRLLGLLVAGLLLSTSAIAAETVPWRKSRIADAIEQPGMRWESWEIRAIDPRGRRALTVRFWAKRNGSFIALVVYRRGQKHDYTSGGGEIVSDRRPGIRLKASKYGSLSLHRGRWRLHAEFASTRGRVDLVLRDHRPGPTIGPLKMKDTRGWLSVVGLGRADGTISFLRHRFRFRNWHAVHLHEWAEWQPFGGDWVRRDLGVLWSRGRVDLVWGIEEFQSGPHGWNPNDALWHGVLARIDGPFSVCNAAARHGAVLPGGGPTATRGVRATCGGRSLAFRWASKIGSAPGGLHNEVTALATSNRGGFGFLDQSLADT
jgi:hypothetical protein